MKKIAINRRYLKRGLGTWDTTGHWFGFPKCCTEAFSRLAHFNEDTENWPLLSTGFIPCKTCATTKTAEQLIAEITAARVCPIPFPNGGGIELQALCQETKQLDTQVSHWTSPLPV